MSVKNHPDPSLVAKDAFRGIRYALKRGAKLVAERGPRQLPEQFEAASTEFLNSAESIAKSVDQIAKQVLGLEFDPKTFGPPSFAGHLEAGHSGQHLSRDASNLFFALTLCAKQLKIADILVSETLCARLIAEDASVNWPVGQQDTAALCAELYRQIIALNILGDPPGVPSQHNADRLSDIRNVAFAAALWTYLERGDYSDSEEDLITMCCDVSAQKADAIAATDSQDEGIRDLFDYALSVV